MNAISHISIRRSTHADGPALERLAALDSGRLADSPYLLAEADGEVIAAMPLGGGAPLADPFRPTAGIVAFLQMRATEPQANGGKGAGLLRRVARPRPRATAQA